MDAAVLSVIVAGFVTASGWLVNNFLTKQREDRTKRLQIGMESAKRQITEFYAPLQSLLTRLAAVAGTWAEIVKKDEKTWESGDKIAYTQYFTPIHDEIISILKTKLYLLGEYFKYNASCLGESLLEDQGSHKSCTEYSNPSLSRAAFQGPRCWCYKSPEKVSELFGRIARKRMGKD